MFINYLKNMSRKFLQATSHYVRQCSSTVDKTDVQRFSKLAEEWWRLDGKLRLLHELNLLRVPFVQDGLVECSNHKKDSLPLKGKKILDVGCGGGILSEELVKLGANVTGIDASEDLINIAKYHSENNPILSNNRPNYICVTVEDHTKSCKNHYDGVVASEIIEHVNNKDLFVESCVESLKQGGRIFFTTPNRTAISYITFIFIAEYLLRYIPKGTHQHEKFITPQELTLSLQKNNCQIESTRGVKYQFLQRGWKFIKSQQMAYAMQAIKM